MGHGGRARRLALFATGVGLAVALAWGWGAGASAHGGEPDPDPEPLLPPAAEGDVQIAPVDQPPSRPEGPEGTVPAEARAAAGDRGGDAGDLDVGDLAGPWGLLALAAVGLTVVGATRLRRMVHLWLSSEVLRQGGFGPPADGATTTFSLLVPARREDPVLGRALDRLAELDHPAFEVLVIVGHDDPATHDIAIAAAARHPDRIRVIAERSFHESASTALNTALDVCRGDVVGVFEAGDKVHPQLLRHVDACLAATGAEVLQGGVQILDLGTSWFGIRNVVERYFWFRSRLHFHAQQGFTPLDVSTVFLRTDVVRAAGGWDAGCVAENCELGVRLSVDGVTTAVAYEPDLATRKLCPETTRDLLRQQTRSIQGFLQVARAGVWRRLPERRQRLLARATLLRPLVEALTGVAVAGVVTAALAGGAPPIVTALALVAVVPLLMTVVVEMAGLAELSRTHGSGIGLRDHLRLVWSAGPYWLLGAVAAMRALLTSGRRPPAGDQGGADDADEVDLTVASQGVIDLTAGETGAGVAANARVLAATPGPDRPDRSTWSGRSGWSEPPGQADQRERPDRPDRFDAFARHDPAGWSDGGERGGRPDEQGWSEAADGGDRRGPGGRSDGAGWSDGGEQAGWPEGAGWSDADDCDGREPGGWVEGGGWSESADDGGARWGEGPGDGDRRGRRGEDGGDRGGVGERGSAAVGEPESGDAPTWPTGWTMDAARGIGVPADR